MYDVCRTRHGKRAGWRRALSDSFIPSRKGRFIHDPTGRQLGLGTHDLQEISSDLMGGTITVESEEGLGSDLLVHVATAAGKRFPDSLRQEPIESSSSARAAAALRILLAEDNPANQEDGDA